MQVEPGDVVVATNNESLPFTITYNKRDYVLKPGLATFVPFECACLWFGDPRAQTNIRSYTGIDGLVAFVADRATEVRRLRSRYGAVYGDETNFANSTIDLKGQPGDPIFIPDVTITSADGEKLWMVVEDPYGNHAELATPTVSDQSDMMKQLKRQQAQIELLLSELGGEHPNLANAASVSDDGEVEPPTDEDNVGNAVKAVK